MPDATLVLDFDGTVCLGDGPVWAYADAVLQRLTESEAARVKADLTEFLAGGPTAADYLDGYDAVARLTADLADERTRSAAYLHSRDALADGSVPVRAPAGLADFLVRLPVGVQTVLVTNAPPTGVRKTLHRLQLDQVIDEIICDAGKPANWTNLLPTLLQGRQPATLMSVGDIWRNDLSVPLRSGCATAQITGRVHDLQEPAHLRAASFPELYPGIASWASDPVGFLTAQHVPAGSNHP